ncbi:MAG TPA: cation-translocating P-type ATPase [Planctomycetota bacterium]|nr:cation-translocating P-type ATPase [Planctomycetota bacterium]
MNSEHFRITFVIQAMDCPDELRIIEGKVRPIPGVLDLRANFIEHTLAVIHDGSVEPTTVRKAIEQAGFAAASGEEHRARERADERAAARWWPRNGRILGMVLSGALLLIAAMMHFILPGIGGTVLLGVLGAKWTVTDAVLLLATLTGGLKLFRSGIRSALKPSADMNLLMTIAVIGAVGVHELFEGASVVFLFALAQWLETRSIDRARDSIRRLLDLSPREAVVIRNGREERVPVETVAVGETLVIKPGEKIPLDGAVVDGTSDVDESPVTGESMPMEKQPGDTVFAGSLNQHGSLTITAAREWKDTTLAKVIHMVEEAQSRRAPSQQFVDRFARYYTPSVLIIAVLIAVVPALLGLPFGVWFYKALVLLVIACPCALVVSTPVTIICALARAAHDGVLIKGGSHLENIGKLDTIIFDKTGTLTQGRPEVVDVLSLNGTEPREVLRVAAAVESRSEHHLARAVLRRAAKDGVQPPAIANFAALPGRGARAEVDGSIYYAGSLRLFREICVDVSSVEPILLKHESEGKAVVLVGTPDRLLGAVVLADVIRPNAVDALHKLRMLGIDDFVMLTGDNEGTAKAIAAQLGMDHYHAGLLPEDKVHEVNETLDERKRAAMVGDGVNDAPALAASTVGIAMGTAGTDAALETADVALMADDLEKLPFAVSLGRRAVAIIRQNITVSLAIKLAFIVLAVAGAATLWSAVVADMGASLLVIFNGMRMLGFREKHRGSLPPHAEPNPELLT